MVGFIFFRIKCENNSIDIINKDIINKELVMIVAKSHDCSSCKMINKMLETNVKNLDQIEVYNIYIDERN